MSEQEFGDQMRETFEWATEQQREGAEVLSNLAAIADVQAVFSDPIEAGDYTIITASENFAGLGFGSGFGGGTGMMGRREESQAEEGSGFGGGAGGVAALRAARLRRSSSARRASGWSQLWTSRSSCWPCSRRWAAWR